jgi:CDP-diacylglycerol--glycerol-3-phosphate 3-phosphatidyltransferase
MNPGTKNTRELRLDISKANAHTQNRGISDMTLADKVTSTRLVLAPVFFVIYFLPEIIPSVSYSWTIPVLWIIFVLSEVSDMLDGMVARKHGEASDFGRLYDPFADTLTQITYFLCFIIDGILPPVLFLVVLYREFSILFVRNLMLKKGITMGARVGGKIKTVLYIFAGGLALLASSAVRLSLGAALSGWLILASKVVFIFSVLVAILSFIDYLVVYMKSPEEK